MLILFETLITIRSKACFTMKFEKKRISMEKRINWICVLILFALLACTNKANKLDIALQQAKENKKELIKVLEYLKDDSLKYRALCFLIENMPYHDYYEGNNLKKYLKYFEVYSDGRHKPEQIVDSLNKADGGFSMHSLIHKYDIANVDSSLLVNNIEWAFKVWQEQPWGKNVCFDDFCEFVLPYRVGDESLTEWREQLYNKYNPLLDSIRCLPQAEDPLFVAQFLIDEWQKKPYNWTMLFPEGPHLGPITTELKAGSCREFTDGVIYILRAVGIPCGTDKTIMRGDNNASHFWAFVLDKNRKTYVTEPIIWTKATKARIMMAKTHRVTYGMNKKWIKTNGDISCLYPTFRYACLQDVTSVYNDSTIYQIRVSAEDMYNGINQKELVYLCLSNRNQWIPVDFAAMQGKQVCFNNVGAGTVCVVATWDGSTLKVQSDPFLVEKETGELKFYHPRNEKEDIALYAKFYLTEGYGDLVYRMAGGVVEGSNRADFADADTLHLIEKAPQRLLTAVYLDNSHLYRYIRYKGPKDSYSNIAELALYENEQDTIPLAGKIMGTPGCWDGDGSHEYTNVFDGDPYTSFDYKYADGGWAGLDLKTRHAIRKIVYVPRNRDNFVRKGDCYELFYWGEGQWRSLGKQIADSDVLNYSIPKGSLLYLRNHSRGNAERIFEYKEGEQRFW